ncbi:LysR family transcriptional regulator [Rubrivivax gelatinosus]|uniref:LysR family transcriptional regulator n=1 Tax=Rubrivivax gelatinosus TaxID=28068 RepID=A0ABS1DYY9_RUBGE|nr:LysR family transcriptional regulator [Rubrivivax gelatinosus]MBK1613856.1 LysR family transcriptional regulator [Rubrivivax gelatinosus]MBK1715312.1 LysR family transcriptional regulator [Rubrivivax gelatinosus]
MDIKLRALRAFTEVVRQGGFSPAARQVFATQSAVSKAVRQLEDALGFMLLDRSVQPARLTAAGEIVLRRSLVVLAELDDLRGELDELRGLQRGVLRLGLPPIGSSQLFAPVFARFRGLYPGIEVQLVEHGSRRLAEMLRAGELDLAGLLVPMADEFEWQSVREEPMTVLLAEAGPAAADGDSIAFAALAGLPFVLFEAGFALNPMVLDAARAAGLEPHVVASTSQIEFMVELVAAGLGAGFLPRLMAQTRQRPGLRVLTLREPALSWHLALAWRRGGYLSHAARAWLELTAAG